MEKRDVLTKVLAVAGTLLVWFPLLLPIALGVMRFASERGFRLDYLMPAELFPVALVGSGMLLWAAWRAGARRRVIGWGLAAAVVFLVGGQALAVVTGLASGAVEAAGWQWGLVLISIAVYTLALVMVGVGGLLLLRDLFASPGAPAASAQP